MRKLSMLATVGALALAAVGFGAAAPQSAHAYDWWPYGYATNGDHACGAYSTGYSYSRVTFGAGTWDVGFYTSGSYINTGASGSSPLTKFTNASGVSMTPFFTNYNGTSRVTGSTNIVGYC